MTLCTEPKCYEMKEKALSMLPKTMARLKGVEKYEVYWLFHVSCSINWVRSNPSQKMERISSYVNLLILQMT